MRFLNVNAFLFNLVETNSLIVVSHRSRYNTTALAARTDGMAGRSTRFEGETNFEDLLE